jgi:hypothetical protein
VELGRLEGGEAGVREITGEMLTDPSKAEVFMRECVSESRRFLDVSSDMADA